MKSKQAYYYDEKRFFEVVGPGVAETGRNLHQTSLKRLLGDNAAALDDIQRSRWLAEEAGDKKILIKRNKDSRESIEYKTAFELEMKQIIPNHKEIVSIMERWRHLVDEDKELSEVLDQYLRHVSTFIAIRDAGEDWKFTELLGSPWHAKLIPVIEAHLKSLRKERKRLEYQAS